MTDQAGRAEVREGIRDDVETELTLATGYDVSNDDALDWLRTTTDMIVRHFDRALAAVEADRDRLQGEVERLRGLGRVPALLAAETRAVTAEAERDEARAQLADARQVLNEKVAAARAEIHDLLAASRPSSPDTTEATTERTASGLMTTFRARHKDLVAAAIHGMADQECDLAAGDTYDPEPYREDAEAAVGAVVEWLAWSGLIAPSSPDTENSRPGYDEIPWVYDEERRQRLADTENSDKETRHG